MISPSDARVLEKLVGTTTFDRGRAYARKGAVRQRTWSPGGTRVVGEVQGGERKPYVTSVSITRAQTGELLELDATCTCPVGWNCKHAVALVLAEDPPVRPGPAPRLTLVRDTKTQPAGDRLVPSGSGPANWQLPIQHLLEEDEPEELGESELGLQFELVLEPRGSGIRVRPVAPGKNGNWVRSGISWSNLDYYRYGKPSSPQAAERLHLVREFLALSRVDGHRHIYSYSDDVVRLETMNSRRLWDIFGEARDLGLPLVQSGRLSEPVAFLPRAADVTVDVTRTDSGLRVEPRIGVEELRVPLQQSMLIGNPAHGIAWWDEALDGTAGPGPFGLGLSALATPVDDNLRAFLRTAAVNVPAPEEKRFLDAFVPKLRRKVHVSSSDRSVDLPDIRPSALVLTITAGDGNRIDLAWFRSAEGEQWREDLWGAASRGTQRSAEEALIDLAAAIVQPVPELFELTRRGRRLAPVSALEGMAAVRFVSEFLPLLEATRGIKVDRKGIVPAYREVEEAPVVSMGGTSTGDNDWFDLTITVTVGGEEVPFADLFVALAAGQSHLILPSGTYFSLDRDELRELAQLIAEARGLMDGPSDGIRLSRFQASLWEDFLRLGVVTAQASAWEDSIRALSDAADRSEHPSPVTLLAILRPYQITGFNWLAYLYEHRLGGVLADDMGLGKTLQALALMCHTKENRLTSDPYLVVAPTSVVGNWVSECRRFAPDLRVGAITETGRRRDQSLSDVAAEVDVLITSYSLFRIEHEEYAAITWAGLFLDEAQFAKNRLSQTYQRAKTLPIPFKVAMSGTPIENNLMELWSLLSIAAPGLFPNPDRFAEYYRVPIEKGADDEKLAQLRRRVRPLMLRRTKEQVATDLPDKQEQVLELDLNPRHKKVYQTYLQRERQKVLGLLGDMNKNRFEIFRSLTLLRQAALDVSLVDDTHIGIPSTKLEALMEMLDDIVSDGHRVLVFSQFTRFLALARDQLDQAGIEYTYLDGQTRNRPAVISEFREGQAPVFLISLKAGGFGLNLTEADYCILLDPWWNPATEAQAVDRIHRIGQTRKVMVYRLVAKDTLEEKVMALKAKKAALFSNVMDGGGFESGAMTAADIRELLD
jgi:superfamily II DNA or RNA helicase